MAALQVSQVQMVCQEQRDTQVPLATQGREVTTASQGGEEQWGLPVHLVNQAPRATKVTQGHLDPLGSWLRESLVPWVHLEFPGLEVMMVHLVHLDLQAHLVLLVK